MNYTSGIIIINKPSGWTSHDVVAKLRGVLKIKRIGHGGTLDPMATGVLPIFIGRATRAVEFFENADKEYIAGMRLGITTDTQDITGTILSTDDREVTKEELKAVIPKFLHAQKQIPPMYSAVKIGGKKLYNLARQGINVERSAREIFISELELLDEGEIKHIWQRNNAKSIDDAILSNDIIKQSNEKCLRFGLKIACSKGTYIRTLCHDIGQVLGCGAAMSELTRTRAGIFSLEKAHTIDEVEKAVKSGDLGKILLPVDTLFENYPALKLSDPDTKKCKNGMTCNVIDIKDGKYRVYSTTGEFLALGEVNKNMLKTIKSFFSISNK